MMAEESGASLYEGGGIQGAARNIESIEFIRGSKNFTHHLDMNTGTISSKREVHFTDTFFMNRYKPHKWIFLENRRAPEEPFYMNHVVKYQYDTVSEINEFKGQLPSLLKRKNVTNLITLGKTRYQSGQELFDTFFRDTPNGKSTQRILNDFGLKATVVERQAIDRMDEFSQLNYSEINFLIQCVPL